MPLPAMRRHHGMAVRTRRRGILFVAGSDPGARRPRRRRRAGGSPTDADAPVDRAAGRRAFGGRGLQETRTDDRGLPDLAIAVVFRGRGGRRGLRSTSSYSLIAAASISDISIISAIPLSSRRRWNACSKSGSNATTRCLQPITGCSRDSTCCANISLFRASFLAAGLPASMNSCRASRRGPSTSSLRSTN